MSIKSLLQFILLLLIILIIGSIYYMYFFQKTAENELLVTQEIIEIKKDKIDEVESADQQILEGITEETDNRIDQEENNVFKEKEIIIKDEKKTIIDSSKKLKNLTKEIQYITTNKDGDIFEILAEFGKTNLENTEILDLEVVKGNITSKIRSKIEIISDFAQYNYTNQNSKFYSNVEIKYDNKIITCDNLDLKITENIAIAYSNVEIKDKTSIMKAQVVTINIITKDIEINSEDKIKILTN